MYNQSRTVVHIFYNHAEISKKSKKDETSVTIQFAYVSLAAVERPGCIPYISHVEGAPEVSKFYAKPPPKRLHQGNVTPNTFS